jgi:uncharacterized membrane protein YedE/YeeE
MPTRASLIVLLVGVVGATALLVGARYGALLLVGLGLGLTLEGLRFGFAGPWRAFILRREPAGIAAQLLAIAGVALVAFPLLAMRPDELVGAHAPVGIAMVGGAFVFGVSMQLVLGCGSGTLVNAGSGNAIALVALPFFAIGSFAGAYHLDWWIDLGTAPMVTLQSIFGPLGGLGATLLGLAGVTAILFLMAAPQNRRIPRRLWIAAAVVAGLAVLNLVISGQPWGVVYGLGLWAAKGAQFFGADLAGSVFWSTPGNVERLQQTILTDVTSLTNIGIILGAFVVASWRGGLGGDRARLPMNGWVVAALAGLLMGYSSRLAFGCNVGAFFSGISTGSLHGWAWFAFAFAGSALGVRLRARLSLEPT